MTRVQPAHVSEQHPISSCPPDLPEEPAFLPGAHHGDRNGHGAPEVPQAVPCGLVAGVERLKPRANLRRQVFGPPVAGQAHGFAITIGRRYRSEVFPAAPPTRRARCRARVSPWP